MIAPIRFCVIDDHPLIHEGLRLLAARTQDIEFCGGALSGRELDPLLRTAQPDVLLFDVNLEGENSFTLCRRVKDRFPDLQVLMVSAFGDAHLLQRSIRAGASGYALKSAALTELPGAIRRVHEKGTFFSSELSEYLLLGLGRSDRSRPDITGRETMIVRLIGQGLTNAEIARELSVSVHTVKFHVSRLLQQYQCRRRAELVKLGDHLP
jgi:DNA-binding NarL/FixJ family response regulator